MAGGLQSATDLVLRVQGYDHGSVGSSACSLYGGVNLCAKLGDTLVKEVRCGGVVLHRSSLGVVLSSRVWQV